MIKTLEEKIVLDNGFIKVYNDEVEFPEGNTGHYFKLSISDRFPNFGVCGLVITEDREVVLMDNFRYAHQDFATETVKGFGMNDKTPQETFEVEMLEEVGFKSAHIENVFKLRGDNHDYFVHCFIAYESEKISDTFHEATEVIKNIQVLPLEDSIELIKEGKIQDTLTVSLLQHAYIEMFCKRVEHDRANKYDN